MANQPGDAFRDHYLQIQALTPTDPASTTAPRQPSFSPELVLLPAILFITVLVIGLIAFIAGRSKSVSNLGNALKLALVLAIVPLGLSLVNLTTNLSSKAGPNHIPQAVTVTDLSPTAFTLSWTTRAKAMSAIRLSLDPTMTPIVQTHSNPVGTKTTSHEFSVTGLTPGTTYYVEVFSEGSWYNNAGQPVTVTLP